MTSMNWLGFSLSPHDLTPTSNPHHHHHHHLNNQSDHDHHRLAYNSDEISGEDVSGECFDLMTAHHHSTAAPFGFLEAFNRTNHHQSQDWNMKGLETNNNNNYKTNSSSSSDLSMIINNNQTLETTHQNNQPKLENFLGRNSFSDHQNHHHAAAMFPAACTLPPATIAGENRTTTNIGLSMIKTWLRNQPETKFDPDANNGGAVSGGGGGTAALSLSMSTGSQSSSALPVESSSSDTKQHPTASAGAAAMTAVDSHGGAGGGIESVPRKSIDTFGQRTSIYRGVTRHRWTGRYEAHLWDNSCRREGQTRKGRQVYLGGYDKEEKAARAYDLAALKYWGTTTTTNFPISNYEKELEEMKHMTRQEYVASLRRKSSGFSRGASIYRGVTRHHQHGRWQARIGRVAGNKDLYLGTFSTQEEAAEAYDIAAIKFRGLNAVTNFDMSRYDVKSILESSTLPIGGAAKRLKDAEAAAQAEITIAGTTTDDDNNTIASHLTDAITAAYGAGWPALSFNQSTAATATAFSMHYPSSYPRVWCKQEEQESSYRDLNNTHNFFQTNSGYHNLMGIDHHNHHQNSSSSNIEHSSGSNSVMYSGGDSGGYAIPMATTVIANDQQQMNSTFGGGGDQDHVFGSGSNTDMANYHRSLYNNYMTSQLGGGVVKAGGGALPYDVHGTVCNNWVPTAVPTTMMPGPRSNSVALCHGITPPFTVWNDA